MKYFSAYREKVYQYRYRFYLLSRVRQGVPETLDSTGLEYRFRAENQSFHRRQIEVIGGIPEDVSNVFRLEINMLAPETEIKSILEKFKSDVLESCRKIKQTEITKRSELVVKDNIFELPPGVWEYVRKKDVDPEYAAQTFREWDRLLEAYRMHLEGMTNSEILKKLPSQYLPESEPSNRARKLKNALEMAEKLVDSTLNGTFPQFI